MRKKFFSVAMLIGALVGIPAMAQEPTVVVDEAEEIVETAQPTATTHSQRHGNGRMKPGHRNNGQRTRNKGFQANRQDRQRPNLFEGLNLTTEQQSQLEALKGSRANNGQAQAEGQNRPDRKAKKQEFLAKVKGILTPEQYTQFLENAFVNGPAKRHHDGGRPRHHGEGQRGQCDKQCEKACESVNK